MGRWGLLLLRISVGIIFFWFGFLKFFPGLSPAETLATRTIEVMTGGLLTPHVALTLLAIWETVIGLGLIFGKALRTTLFLLFLQMPGTISPMFLFPELTFQQVPFVLTIEGQYIVKNLVLVSAGIVIGATVRGGGLVVAREPSTP
ncbi:MAG: DoxX family membrane protein [Gemmatimonadota bacterium]